VSAISFDYRLNSTVSFASVGMIFSFFSFVTFPPHLSKSTSSLPLSLSLIGQDGFLCLWSIPLEENSKENESINVAIAKENGVINDVSTYPSLSEITILKPHVSHRVHHHPLSSVAYLSDFISMYCFLVYSETSDASTQ